MQTIDAVRNLGWSGKDQETIAIEALQFLADRPEAMRRFLEEAAIEAASLRNFARLPAFKVAVLDFIVNDDQAYLAFRWSSGLQRIEIAIARSRFDHSYGWD